jgi:hypothetical protein
VHPETSRLEAATDYLLGNSVGSLEDHTSEFAAAFNEVQRVQALKSRAGSVVELSVAKVPVTNEYAVF